VNSVNFTNLFPLLTSTSLSSCAPPYGISYVLFEVFVAFACQCMRSAILLWQCVSVIFENVRQVFLSNLKHPEQIIGTQYPDIPRF